MPRPAIMYSEILRRQPALRKTRTTSPLEAVESDRFETMRSVPYTPSSSSSDSSIDDYTPPFSPELPIKVVCDDHDDSVDFLVYTKPHLPSPHITPTFHVYTNRKASIETIYIPPPPLAKPYVDKLLGPKSNEASCKVDATNSTNTNTLSIFDPFVEDPEGSTRSPPPNYRLPLLELLPCRKPKPDGEAAKKPPLTRLDGGVSPKSTPSSDYSLKNLFLQYGIEPTAYFLPPGLFDDNDDVESYPACSKSCLVRRFTPSRSPSDRQDEDHRPPSSTSSNSRRITSAVPYTNYSMSPALPLAPSAYLEDHSFYHRRKAVAQKWSIVKFNSPGSIGVSLEAVLSREKGRLIDPNDEVMEHWGEKGKPAFIRLIITRNGFKRVFPIQIRCLCGVITRAELAYEIANIMQRDLAETKPANLKLDSERSIAGLHLLSIRIDNKGFLWRATFADRRRIKTDKSLGKLAQRR